MEESNMYIIASVRRDKKEKRRYHLYMAGEEEPFLSVHEDIMIKFRLLKEVELDGDTVRHIKDEDQRYRAYVLSVAYLGVKPRTAKQIGQYLAKKELDETHIEYAIQRLETEKLVDDEEYARQFAESRLRSGQKGRLMIRQELQQRGVSKQLASETLSALDRSSELEAAKTLAHKKARSLTGENAKRRTKLMSFLLRRGFPGDIVREAMRSVDLSSDDRWEEEDDGVLLDN
ncbi:RecX family transcriptional regulator [Paenibacillus agaridevorans]|uniref:Regulatory protein RecX n=1 Tax=Paenibacillus agaridevorans TaxID=171404 RepID=A0A2R5EVI1_9BACL|nr:RecX family transcriptional regulator [Paenibacillus agaridevorans]GBG09669.1 RecX family transcriptional regulator [Paenibacillus agaridevorans]